MDPEELKKWQEKARLNSEACSKAIQETLKDVLPYTEEELLKYAGEFIDIPKRRWFHYEKFPGFIGPAGRRFIFLEWIWMLIFNTHAYIFNRSVVRTLYRFTFAKPVLEIHTRDDN
jgi:hypothetical protein